MELMKPKKLSMMTDRSFDLGAFLKGVAFSILMIFVLGLVLSSLGVAHALDLGGIADQVSIIGKILNFGQEYAVYIIPVILVIEYFLGQTTLVRSGSVIEMILNGLARLLKFLTKKKE